MKVIMILNREILEKLQFKTNSRRNVPYNLRDLLSLLTGHDRINLNSIKRSLSTFVVLKEKNRNINWRKVVKLRKIIKAHYLAITSIFKVDEDILSIHIRHLITN